MQLWSPALLPFLIPVGVVVLLIALQAFLLITTGISLGFEADADIDLDVDADVDADVDVDADAGDAGHAGHGSLLSHLLQPLGVGQVPLTVVGQAFGLSWGVSGVALTYGLRAFLGPAQPWFLAVTLPASLALAWLATRRLVRLVLPLLRVSGKAESARDLVGKQGVVTSLRVDPEYGEVRITVNGAPNYLYVRSSGETVARGGEVVVVGYDVDAQRPIVAAVSPTVSTS